MLARFVVNSHVKHHPNRDEDAVDDEGLMVGFDFTNRGINETIWCDCHKITASELMLVIL